MKIIETRTAFYSVIEKGLLKVEMKENAHVTLKDAQENYETSVLLTNGERYAALVEGKEQNTIADDAHEFSSRAETFKNVIAMAIVINSLSTRLLGVLVMNMNKRNHNTIVQVFNDKDAALLWIKEKIQEEKIVATKVN